MKSSREYEVEVRSYIPESEFQDILDKLTDLFGNPMPDELKTFLFRNENSNGRIRIVKGSDFGILTEKIGNYTDKSRVEIEKDFSFSEVGDILSELNGKGLNNCTYLLTTSYRFLGPNSQILYLAKHENLGNFLEVEIMINDQSKIHEAHKAVCQTLANLNLKELPAAEYQQMMNDLYALSKPVSGYIEQISSF